jgi:hypothetical protein
MKDVDPKSTGKGTSSTRAGFMLKEKMRLPAADVSLEAFTTLLSSRKLFRNLLDMESPTTVSGRELRPTVS